MLVSLILISSLPRLRSPDRLTTAQTDPTIAAKLEAEYLSSRQFLTLAETKGVSALSGNERTAYASSKFLETGIWRSWADKEQKEFWKQCEQLKVPTPLSKPQDLGRDSRGREIGSYSVLEYKEYLKVQQDVQGLRRKSEGFKQRREEGRDIEGEVEDERSRRKLIGGLSGKKMGIYEGDPEWDDVVPIPQDDGENALAAIAYTDEYAEGMTLHS